MSDDSVRYAAQVFSFLCRQVLDQRDSEIIDCPVKWQIFDITARVKICFKGAKHCNRLKSQGLFETFFKHTIHTESFWNLYHVLST